MALTLTPADEINHKFGIVGQASHGKGEAVVISAENQDLIVIDSL
jgi:hypothetical protein